MVDMFATKRNAKLPIYVSPVPDQVSWAEEALSLNWTGLNLSTSNHVQVLEKILQVKGLEILVASAWLTQSWYSLLLDMSIDHLLKLPIFPRLLKQTDKPMFHKPNSS